MSVETLQTRLDDIVGQLMTSAEAAHSLDVSAETIISLVYEQKLTLLSLRDLCFVAKAEVLALCNLFQDDSARTQIFNQLPRNQTMPASPAPSFNRLRRYPNKHLHPLQQILDILAYDLLSFNETLAYLNLQPDQLQSLIEQDCFEELTLKQETLLAFGEVEDYRLRSALSHGAIMNIKFLQNKFLGINPLLHNMYQTPNMDVQHRIFHSTHLIDLSHALNKELLPRGYKSRAEKRLKIGRNYYPDIDILTNPSTAIFPDIQPTSHPHDDLVAASPTLIIDPPESQMHIVISKMDDDSEDAIPVTMLELLSPTNLQDEAHRNAYLHKRTQILENGLNLIELHYLNTYPPYLAGIPLYPEEEAAAPYHIIVTRQRPEVVEFPPSEVYLFGIDQPVPTIAIPLLGIDQLIFSFDQVYQQTYEAEGLGSEVNYDGVTETILSTFKSADQATITTIVEAAREEYFTLKPHLRPQNPPER